MRRREFLLGSLATVTYVACGSSADGPAGVDPDPNADGGATVGDAGPPPTTSPVATSEQLFPQGLASGDPRPDRVLLWTRVEAAAIKQSAATLDVTFLIAEDEALTKVVATGTVKASPSADHTVRVVATGLKA